MADKLDLTVLYVEDDKNTRMVVKDLLGRHVRDVYLAADGNEGLNLFASIVPDITITDIRMPGMNGLDMAREIKKKEQKAHIIVTTAYNDTDFFLDAIDIGIDQYVLKPIDQEKLFLAIGKIFTVIDMERTIRQKEQEQKRLIGELREAVAKIKTLKGMIPICASCKKIRDDAGFWKQVEVYISEHTDADFSHGLCPDCAKRLYPEYFDSIVKHEEK